jgi:hypothetical protein
VLLLEKATEGELADEVDDMLSLLPTKCQAVASLSIGVVSSGMGALGCILQAAKSDVVTKNTSIMMFFFI